MNAMSRARRLGSALLASFSLALAVGCSAPSLGRDDAKLPEAYDGTTIFRGVFFGQGPAAEAANRGRPEAEVALEREEIARQLAALGRHYEKKDFNASAAAARTAAGVLHSEGADVHEASPAERARMIQVVLRRIHASDPTFFRRFGIAMRSGNTTFVERALREGSARIFAVGFGTDAADEDADALDELGIDVERESPEQAFRAKKAKKKKVTKSKKKVKRKKAKKKKKAKSSGTSSSSSGSSSRPKPKGGGSSSSSSGSSGSGSGGKVKSESGTSGSSSESLEKDATELDDEFKDELDEVEASEEDISELDDPEVSGESDDPEEIDPDDPELEDPEDPTDDDDGFAAEESGEDISELDDPDVTDDELGGDGFDDGGGDDDFGGGGGGGGEDFGGGDEGGGFEGGEGESFGGDDTGGFEGGDDGGDLQAFRPRRSGSPRTTSRATVVLGKVKDGSVPAFFAWRYPGKTAGRSYAKRLRVVFAPK